MGWVKGIPDLPCYGWIHPDGRVWECEEFVHLKSAADVVADLKLEPAVHDFGHGPVEEQPDDTLYRHGFYKLYDDGDAYNEDDVPATQAQLNTLLDLSRTHPRMARQIQNVLRWQQDQAS